MSAQSMVLDWDRKRLRSSAFLGRLHLHGKAEVFRRLLGDARNGGDGRPRMAHHDIFEILL
jgi:hypothetical protein